jgi:hypothetical protein
VAPEGPCLTIVESSANKHPFTKDTALGECHLWCLPADIGLALLSTLSCSEIRQPTFASLCYTDSATPSVTPMVVPTDAPTQGSTVPNEALRPHCQAVAPPTPSKVFRSIPHVTPMAMPSKAPGRDRAMCSPIPSVNPMVVPTEALALDRTKVHSIPSVTPIIVPT